MNQLKNFAKKTFTKSEVFRDYPTVGIEVEKIKFELLLALNDKYEIPGSPRKDLKRSNTNPSEFRENLLKKNASKNEMTITLVLLLRCWNYLNGNKFLPYDLESIVIKESYGRRDLKEDFYKFVLKLSRYRPSDDQKEIVNTLSVRFDRLQIMESNGITEYLDQEWNSLLPMP